MAAGASLVWSVGMVALLPIAPAAHLRLTFTPMQSGVAEQLTIPASGQAEFFEYDRYQLVVEGRRAGAAEPSILSLNRALEEALQTKSWGEVGLARGDQFVLEFTGDRGDFRRTMGFLDDAPPVLRDYIRKLLQLRSALTPASLAAGYLRAELVAPDRRQYLSGRGQKFTPLGNLPIAARGIIQQAAAQPGDFSPIAGGQLQILGGLGRPAWEYVQINSSVFQMTLFSSKTGDRPPGRGNNVVFKIFKDSIARVADQPPADFPCSAPVACRHRDV